MKDKQCSLHAQNASKYQKSRKDFTLNLFLIKFVNL